MEDIFRTNDMSQLHEPTVMADIRVQWIERLRVISAIWGYVGIGKRRHAKVYEIFNQRMAAQATLVLNHTVPARS